MKKISYERRELRLWVGRRKEPILCYVPKNYERKNSGNKVLKISAFCNIFRVNIFFKKMWFLFFL